MMSTRIPMPLLALALLLGCSDMALEAGLADGGPQEGDDDAYSGDDDDDLWGDDDDQSGNDDCEIKGTSPVDGDPTAYYRDPIEVYFSEPVLSVSITLSSDGGDVWGTPTIAEDGMSASFDPYGGDPDLHLEPLTAYGAHVESSGCSADWTFSTSELGTDMDAGFELEGSAYVVYLDEAELVEPLALEAMFLSLGLDTLLMGITAQDGDQVSLRAGGLADLDETEQNLCAITLDLTESRPAILSGSHLSLEPVMIDLPFEQGGWSMDTEYWLYGAQIGFEAEFTPDGSGLTEGRIEGAVDGFGLDSLLADLTNDHDTYWQGSTCDLLEDLGSPCTACPGNPQQQSCIPFVIDDVEAALAGSLSGVAEVTAADAFNCN